MHHYVAAVDEATEPIPAVAAEGEAEHGTFTPTVKKLSAPTDEELAAAAKAPLAVEADEANLQMPDPSELKVVLSDAGIASGAQANKVAAVGADEDPTDSAAATSSVPGEPQQVPLDGALGSFDDETMDAIEAQSIPKDDNPTSLTILDRPSEDTAAAAEGAAEVASKDRKSVV